MFLPLSRPGKFSLGAGRDKTSFAGDPVHNRIAVRGRLQIIDTLGPSRVFLSGVDVTKETAITTSNSIDRVTMDGSSFRRTLDISTRGGNDFISNTGGRFHAGGTIAPGAGKDTVIGLDDLLA